MDLILYVLYESEQRQVCKSGQLPVYGALDYIIGGTILDEVETTYLLVRGLQRCLKETVCLLCVFGNR